MNKRRCRYNIRQRYITPTTKKQKTFKGQHTIFNKNTFWKDKAHYLYDEMRQQMFLSNIINMNMKSEK